MATINSINNVLKGTEILDTNNNEVLKITATASAVNEVTLANAATGGSPTLSATGNDTNIGLNLMTKGTGLLEIGGGLTIGASGYISNNPVFGNSGTAVRYLAFSNTGVAMFLGIEGSAGAQILGGTQAYAGVIGTEGNDPLEICTLTTPRIRIAGAGTITVNSAINYAADAQATDSYVITLNPVPTVYSTGMQIIFKANTANTGAATIDVNSLGAKTIVKRVNTTLANSDILAGMFCHLVYDGTNFVLLNPVVN